VALVVRGLALDQIHRGNLLYLAIKEMGIALINGLLWGSVMGLIAWLLYNNLELGLVMAGATLLNLLVAAAAGIGVPIGIERLGRDPALGSSVVLTFVTDSMGFFIFLGLATLVLIH
jgi:magnesium transporter